MPDRIVIEGGTARHERVEVLSEAPLESISEHLIRRVATTFPVMPAHPVRYMYFDGETNRGLWLVEAAPTKRNIRVIHSRNSDYSIDRRRRGTDDNPAGSWLVQVPWQYFAFGFSTTVRAGSFTGFTIDRTDLYWSKDQLRGENHPMIVAPVPNVEGSGHICWGSTRPDNTSLNARIDDFINSFLISTFNEDLGHNTPFGGSLTDWETASANPNPLAWRDWDIWIRSNTITPAQIPTHARTEAPPGADISESFLDLPELPVNFTVARAQQYLASLTPAARQRFTFALGLTTEDTEALETQEATA